MWPELKMAREKVKLNRWLGWDCQDLVMDLLEVMEGEGVVDVVRGMRDSGSRKGN